MGYPSRKENIHEEVSRCVHLKCIETCDTGNGRNSLRYPRYMSTYQKKKKKKKKKSSIYIYIYILKCIFRQQVIIQRSFVKDDGTLFIIFYLIFSSFRVIFIVSGSRW